jgi:hypothetical protein
VASDNIEVQRLNTLVRGWDAQVVALVARIARLESLLIRNSRAFSTPIFPEDLSSYLSLRTGRRVFGLPRNKTLHKAIALNQLITPTALALHCTLITR